MRRSMRDIIEKNIEMSLVHPNFGLGTEVGIRQFDPNTPKNKYGESREKSYLPVVFIKGTVIVNPTEEQLMAEGMAQEQVSFLFKCSTKTLRENDLADEDTNILITPNDMLEYRGEVYDIKKVRPVAHLSGIPLLVTIGAKKAAS